MSKEKNERKAFVCYIDWWERFEPLSEKERAQMLEALFVYAGTGQVPENLERVVQVVFEGVKPRIDQDKEAWLKKCEQNAKNIRSRYERIRPNTTEYDRIRNDEKDGKGYGRTLKNNNNHPIINDSVSIGDKSPTRPRKTKGGIAEGAKGEKPISAKTRTTGVPSEPTLNLDVEEVEGKKPGRRKFVAPTEQECVNEFLKQGGTAVEAAKFFSHYNSQDWYKSNGRRITNLASAVSNWILNQSNYARHKSDSEIRAERNRNVEAEILSHYQE